MKRNWTTLLLALVFALGLTTSALAAEGSASAFVYDEADLLTWEEEQELNQQAAEIALDYGCGVYVAAVDSYADYDSAGVWDAANQLYVDLGWGIGPNDEGILLLLSISDRYYALTLYGPETHTTFPDPVQSSLEDNFLDDFGYDDWYGGFSDYLDDCEDYLDLAAQGVYPAEDQYADDYYQDYDYHEESSFPPILPAVFLALVVALIVCLVFKRQLKTARIGSTASDYITEGGLDLRVRHDQYLHTTVTRHRIEKNDSGGGSHRHSGGGFSGRSGKF